MSATTTARKSAGTGATRSHATKTSATTKRHQQRITPAFVVAVLEIAEGLRERARQVPSVQAEALLAVAARLEVQAAKNVRAS